MKWDRDLERHFNIEQVLKEREVAYIQNNTHIIIKNCPICGGRNKLFLDKSNKKWVCFKCVKTNDFTIKEGRGNLQTFLMKVCGLSKTEMEKTIAEGSISIYADPDMEYLPSAEAEDSKQLKSIELPRSFLPLSCEQSNISSNLKAYKYLFDRHVNEKRVILEHQLLFDAVMDRVVFQIFDEKLGVVGWQGRDITDRWKTDQPRCTAEGCPSRDRWKFGHAEKCPDCGSVLEMSHYPKSMNSKNFPKTEAFYGSHCVDWSKEVRIVEGPFDSINTPNSLALLGKVLSSTQLNILLKKAENICLYFDGDEAGRFSMEHTAMTLIPFYENLKVCLLEDQQDPGSFTREGNLRMLSEKSIFARDWLRLQ